MDNSFHVRRGWLKAMYFYTLIGAGGTGLGMVFFPDVMRSTLGLPAQDPVIFKLYGSVLLASGLAAIPALRRPLRFVPLLLIQLIYKPIWLAVVAVPMFLKGQFPLYVVMFSVIFLTYIIGDLIAIPFSYLFSRE
jgi:uncharacterized membrane protein